MELSNESSNNVIVVYSKKFGKVIQIEIGQEKLKNNDNKQKTWGNWSDWSDWLQWSDWDDWVNWRDWMNI